MRVAADHETDPDACEVEGEIVDVVHDVDANRPRAQRPALGEMARPGCPVVVAAHGDDGSDRAQRGEHLRRSDVSRVYDQVTRAQSVECLAPDQAVGIRDQAEARRRRSPR